MSIAFQSRAPRRAMFATALAGAVLWLAGCASLQPKTTEDVVRQRAEERWAALIDAQFPKAWQYTQPGFRAIVKQADYAKRFGAGARWDGVQVHEVTCEAERCAVRVRLSMTMLTPPFTGQKIVNLVDETWVREDGQWWFYQAL